MAIGHKIPVEAIRKALAENSVLKWAVIGFLAIFAVEFLAKEGIGLWKELATVQRAVEQKNAEAETAKVAACRAKLPMNFSFIPPECNNKSGAENTATEKSLQENDGGEFLANAGVFAASLAAAVTMLAMASKPRLWGWVGKIEIGVLLFGGVYGERFGVTFEVVRILTGAILVGNLAALWWMQRNTQGAPHA